MCVLAHVLMHILAHSQSPCPLGPPTPWLQPPSMQRPPCTGWHMHRLACMRGLTRAWPSTRGLACPQAGDTQARAPQPAHGPFPAGTSAGRPRAGRRARSPASPWPRSKSWPGLGWGGPWLGAMEPPTPGREPGGCGSRTRVLSPRWRRAGGVSRLERGQEPGLLGSLPHFGTTCASPEETPAHPARGPGQVGLHSGTVL